MRMAKNAENPHERNGASEREKERKKGEINGKSQPTINRVEKLKYSKFVRNQGIRMCHVICVLFCSSTATEHAYTLIHTNDSLSGLLRIFKCLSYMPP